MVEERVLTPEAEDKYLEWGKLFDSVGCTCWRSAPCVCCSHPGHPANLEGDESAWIVTYREETEQEKQWGTW